MHWKMNIFSCKQGLQMFLFYIFFLFCTISSFCDLPLQCCSSGTGRLCFVRLPSAPSLPFSYIHGAQAARRSLSLLAQRGFSPSIFFYGWQSLIFHKCQMGMEQAWKHRNFLLAEAVSKYCRGDGGEGCEIGRKHHDQIWDQRALIFLSTAALDFDEVTEWAKDTVVVLCLSCDCPL